MNEPAALDAWFPLIDLRTQAGAVTQHVQGWTEPQILAWLRHHGEVVGPTRPDSLISGLTMQERDLLGPPLYQFRSSFGLWAAFRFLSDGTFEVWP